MRIGRTLPPAAAPITLGSICSGFAGVLRGEAEVGRFQRELAAYHQVSHSFLLSSGKAALSVTLMALKNLHPERDEVLIPAYTCYSVPAAIVRAGLKVRICDVESETLDFDFSELADHLTSSRLLAVLPTHLFGTMADVARVKSLRQGHLPVIVEDAAQAMGEEDEHGKAGTLGDVGILSLGRGKVFSTVEGGVILTNNYEIAQGIKNILSEVPSYTFHDQFKLGIYAVALWLLIRPWLYWFPKMLPFLGLGETHFDPEFSVLKLSPFQAGLSRGWQRRTAELRSVREANSVKYLAAGLDCPAKLRSTLHSHIRFPAYVQPSIRATIVNKSNSAGFGVVGIYPTTVAKIPGISSHLVSGCHEKAEGIAARIISLPVHPFVSVKDVDNIINLLQTVEE